MKGKNLGIDEGEREEERMDMEVEGSLAIVPIEGETNVDYDGVPTNLEQKTNAGCGIDPINLEQEHNTGYSPDTVDEEIHRVQYVYVISYT